MRILSTSTKTKYFEPYLSPEPLLQRTSFAKNAASIGLTLPTYAYKNPLRYSDRNGNLACSNTYDCCVLRLGPEACGGTIAVLSWGARLLDAATAPDRCDLAQAPRQGSSNEDLCDPEKVPQ